MPYPIHHVLPDAEGATPVEGSCPGSSVHIVADIHFLVVPVLAHTVGIGLFIEAVPDRIWPPLVVLAHAPFVPCILLSHRRSNHHLVQHGRALLGSVDPARVPGPPAVVIYSYFWVNSLLSLQQFREC